MDAVERKVSIRDQPAFEETTKKKKTTADQAIAFPVPQDQEDSEGEGLKDADKILAQRFKVYDVSLKDIQNILTYWDRKQGVQLPPAGMEDLSHEPDDQRQAPSGGGGGGGGGGRRGRKDRERERLEKERAEKERLEREKAERERLEKLRAMEERSDLEVEGDEEQHEGKKDLGVPFINIQTPDFEGVSWKQALESDRLPKEDQVQLLLCGETTDKAQGLC